MRLINVNTFKLEEFLDYRAPPYAILSHTWGNDSEELNFRDVEDGNIDKPGIGSVKFRGTCRQAARDNLGYAWIDTCCIDKTNLVELSEAINSMFRWYHRSTICYAFLSDVPTTEDPRKAESKFQRSRWFQRGWTLQELLAPKTMRFYCTILITSRRTGAQFGMNQEWHLLGTKGSMSTTIASVTGIPREYLLGIARLHTASIAQRMSWAAHRDTKRKEDLAYCLLGIFDITMPMIYGEGGDQAFFRLQEQIMKVTRDDSILAWGLGSNESSAANTGKAIAGRVMAKSPADFANSGHIICRDQSLNYMSSVDISGGSIRAYLPLLITSTGQTVGLLNCGPEKNAQQVVGIPLIELAVGSSDEYARPRGYNSFLHSTTAPATTPKPIRIKHDSQENVSLDSSGLYFHYEDSDFTDINLKIIDVLPKSCWDEERALITSMPGTKDGTLGQILIRLRQNEAESKDFVMVLEYKEENTDILAECLVLICSRNTVFEELATNLPSMMQKLYGKMQAKNGLLSLRVTLERVARQPIFLIQPESVFDEVFTTFDATLELEGKLLANECLQLLDENEEIQREENELEDKLKHHDEILKEVKEKQDVISAKIKELEERQKELAEAEKANIEKRAEMISKQVEMEEKLQGLSDQWEHKQRLWNALHHVVDFNFGWKGRTALEWAAAYGLIDVVKKRLEEGADVNAPDNDGCTPLLAASLRGNLEMAKLLIEEGAVLGAADNEGVTPILAASASGCFELVELLLAEGADIESKSKDNITPLIAASGRGHPNVARLLLERGADINFKAREDITALLIASVEGYIDVVQLLLDKGAEIDAKNNRGETALLAVSRRMKKDVIQLLVNRGADVELRDEYGVTMLMGASGAGLTDIVRQLLDMGKGNLYAQDEKGRTALDWATENGHQDIVQLLRDAEEARS